MLEKYSGEDNSTELGTAMIEVVSVVDWGKMFAEICYTLEGGYTIFTRVGYI